MGVEVFIYKLGVCFGKQFVIGFVFVCGMDEIDEQWMVVVWGGQEFWVCLVGQELWVGIVWQFDYFYQGVVY